MSLMYGKKAARKLVGVGFIPSYTTAKLPAPPEMVLYGEKVKDWGMYFNDQLGDCTEAGRAHLIICFNAEVASTDVVPTPDQIKTEYGWLSPGDQGCVMVTVLNDWKDGKLVGPDVTAWAPVDHKSITALHEGIYYFGGLYVGIQCPTSAQSDFAHTLPWTVHKNARIEGGHCIILIGYDQHYVYAVSWGKVVKISYPFLAKYLDEAYVVIPQEFVEKGRGPQIDLASLQADLAQVNHG